MLNKREIALSKVLNKNPLDFQKGNEPFQYSYNDTGYLVLTEEESFIKVLSYFKDDFSTYCFELPFLSKVLNIEERVLESKFNQYLDEDKSLCGNQELLTFIEEKSSLEKLVRVCFETNGGYGYYLNPYDNSQIEQDGYLIYRYN